MKTFLEGVCLVGQVSLQPPVASVFPFNWLTLASPWPFLSPLTRDSFCPFLGTQLSMEGGWPGGEPSSVVIGTGVAVGSHSEARWPAWEVGTEVQVTWTVPSRPHGLSDSFNMPCPVQSSEQLPSTVEEAEAQRG